MENGIIAQHGDTIICVDSAFPTTVYPISKELEKQINEATTKAIKYLQGE